MIAVEAPREGVGNELGASAPRRSRRVWGPRGWVDALGSRYPCCGEFDLKCGSNLLSDLTRKNSHADNSSPQSTIYLGKGGRGLLP